jgi:parallel beta-helix repeat protein
MSKYNANDASPSWADYAGNSKFRINMTSSYACCFSIGWDGPEYETGTMNYVTLRGFEVTGRGARVRWGGSYSVLEHMWVHDVTDLGATVQFDGAVTDYPGCRDLGKHQDITVRNNLIERGIGEGLYMAGNYTLVSDGGCPSYGNTHSDILIEGNTIRDSGINGDQGDGIDLKTGLMNVTVRNNVIQDTHPNPVDESDGITASGVFPPAKTNYLIEGNRISNTWHGMILGDQNGTVIRNNVVANCTRTGIYAYGDLASPSAYFEIYNNTVYGNAGGVGTGEISASKFRNNLVFGNGTGNQIGGWGSTGPDSDYNFLAPAGSDYPEGPHSIIQAGTSGLVVSATGGDFHLDPASPARDQGTDLANTGFSVDFDRVARPKGPAWDIGAYEYPSGP